MQSRWRSKYAWASLLMLIVFVLKTYFNYEIPQADQLINLLLAVGCGFGIFNNPENKEGY